MASLKVIRNTIKISKPNELHDNHKANKFNGQLYIKLSINCKKTKFVMSMLSKKYDVHCTNELYMGH